MADKLTVEIELDPEISRSSRSDIEKKAARAGQKAGDRFEKEFKKETDSLGSGLSSNFAKIAGSLTAAFAAFRTLSTAVDLAARQEDAINNLNVALQITGKFSQQASQDIQDLATSIQQATRFGDEEILETASLIQQLGRLTVDELGQATQAAVDLAAGLRIDLNTAATLVGKAAAGQISTFSRYGLAIKTGANNSETFANALESINKGFGGSAAAQVNTYAGAQEQLSNAIGDAFEQLGFFATRNESFLNGIKNSISFVNDFAAGLEGIRISLLGIQPSSELQKVEQQIAVSVDKGQKLRDTLADLKDGNLFGFISAGDQASIDALPERIAKVDMATQDLIKRRQELLEQSRSNAQQQDEISEQTTQKQISDLQLLQQARSNQEALIIAQQNQRLTALGELRARELITRQELADQTLLITQETEDQLDAARNARVEKDIEANGTITQAVVQAAKTQQASLVGLGKQVVAISVNGFGKAFSNIGKALANGESASKAFVDSVKGTFGELASAVGDYYIKQGIARTIASDPGGPALIAAGAGLKVLAGVLGSSGSSSGDTQATAAGFGTQPNIQEAGGFDQAEIEETEPNTNVQVVIQGNVLDSDETGTEIARTLSDAFGKQGIVLAQPRFAN